MLMMMLLRAACAGSWMLLNGTHLALLFAQTADCFVLVLARASRAGRGWGRGWMVQMRKLGMLGNGAMGSCWAYRPRFSLEPGA